jgi:hypothetical protein
MTKLPSKYVRPFVPQSNSLTDLRERVKIEHAAVVGSLRQGLEHALNAGALLGEARRQLRHGEWLPWLKSCGIEERTAQRYLKLAKNRALIEAKADTMSDLSITGALALIAVPRAPKHDELASMMAELGDLAASGAFDSLDLTAMAEAEATGETRTALLADASAALDKIGKLMDAKPALREIVDAFWDDKPKEDRFFEGNTLQTAMIAEMGVNEETYNQMSAEFDRLTSRGADRSTVAFKIWKKFRREFDEAIPGPSATAMLSRVRDICGEWLHYVETADVS